MSRDYFSILGLTPGRYEPGEIARRFHARRKRLLAELDDPAKHRESRRRLDELHRAYHALRDPRLQSKHLHAAREPEARDDRVEYLRRLIESSLEGGLLRYSRRVDILAEGRRLGFSDFHTQLLIAQVQFGGEIVARPDEHGVRAPADTGARVGARFAAAGLLALAIFLAMIRWLGT